MRVSLMIEGQEGVTWPQWLALAEACEAAGLEGLFRSDHYTGIHGGEGGALDAWATIAGLAARTGTLRLGTLVSPVTFRHPSVLARMAVTASEISGGRVELGLGSGWFEAEHRAHGIPFPPVAERTAMFAEQLEIIARSFRGGPFDFEGRFYTLEGAMPLPTPSRPIRIVVGGTAKPGTVGPAARLADEYNTFSASPQEARIRREAVVRACEAAGRAPIAFSLMTQGIVGETEAEVARRRQAVADLTGKDPAERAEAKIEGTVDEVAERLREYEAVGVERVMLQHLVHADLEMVELIGRVQERVV
jgi:alkanesulfonate monooxygenase SsuD/methylene tetrahydromethanopterin reductase-like flavin-dependent oxidoreductase (luciferase family)